MKTRNLIFQFLFCVTGMQLLIAHTLSGQDTIYLDNPSFEDIPRAGTAYTPSIVGWNDCGHALFPGETPPDIHPVPAHAWDVSMQSFDGKTYLGLVVRYNGTYESVSQKLTQVLKKDKCYSFSAFLARSDSYRSGTMRSNAKLENFISPAVLRIWGGNKSCDLAELLGQSYPVDHANWKEYNFVLWPKEDYSFITIAAYFADDADAGYNGHVMVDNLSQITEMECK
ncbi:MAG: hypothetical protein IPP15_21800 [Saprospiraceae bacterium]|uniref:Uncharacterized protein n=1 Tax=Candidatus Opimibacter skivensis TaxID=2982028 RepID=A0A9D7SXB3_9BACT|nr:hypothetical protein [Candidatus Opimibacter skivensis]